MAKAFKGSRRSEAVVVDRQTADYDRQMKRKSARKVVEERAKAGTREARARSEDREAALEGFNIPKKKRKVAFQSSSSSSSSASGSDYHSASGSAPGSDSGLGLKRNPIKSKHKAARMAEGFGRGGSPARFKSPAAPIKDPHKVAGAAVTMMIQKSTKPRTSLDDMEYMQKAQESGSEASASEASEASDMEASDVEASDMEYVQKVQESSSEASEASAFEALQQGERATSEEPPRGQNCALTRAGLQAKKVSFFLYSHW